MLLHYLLSLNILREKRFVYRLYSALGLIRKIRRHARDEALMRSNMHLTSITKNGLASNASSPSSLPMIRRIFDDLRTLLFMRRHLCIAASIFNAASTPTCCTLQFCEVMED